MKHNSKPSPWGPVQGQTVLAPGIVSVSTASHGGIKLDAAHQKRMPESFRVSGGWYEEDCDWCLPCVVFQAELVEHGEPWVCKAILDGTHISTMRNWHPDLFESWFQTEIEAGRSYMKDQRAYKAQHAEDYLVTSAFGSWHETVPAGYVGVVATVGGRGGTGPEIHLLVPETQYATRKEGFSFAIPNPGKYVPWVMEPETV